MQSGGLDKDCAGSSRHQFLQGQTQEEPSGPRTSLRAGLDRLANPDHPVNFQFTLCLSRTAWPCDFEAIDFGGAAQAEMQPQIVLRKVAAARTHLIDLGPAPCCKVYPRVDSAAV